MPVNPYESPPSDDPDSLDAAEPTVEARLIGLPAGGLIATAGLSIVTLLVGIGVHLYLLVSGQFEGVDPASGISVAGIVKVRMAYGVIVLLVNAAILHGALKMRQLKDLRYAESTCLLACVPCCSPCVVLGIPFGIWGLTMLHDRQVKEAFKS